MGFPCGSISVPNSVSFLIVISLLRYAKLVASVILKGPNSEVVSADQEFDVYRTGFHEFPPFWPSPSLVPAKASVLVGARKRLPVVEFGDFVRLNLREDEGAALCSICLQEIERRHEIREPTKCRHAFHRECLDGWVDEGHVTCPLCKTALFEGEEERSIVGDLRTTEANTNFFRDY
ncbi:brassinosteroid-responsive RING protein 1-like [Rhodamnia argentea]|uniref:Brassinosteroid-responsive RING protein 1-like n=1 Tax=Rhodamnia argentea TaxID=178133 RepID=A0A8B8N808_9MYRT|nr:brassinosteroid-responsive RING protein 1-like [Rhodamnia argentea]